MANTTPYDDLSGGLTLEEVAALPDAEDESFLSGGLTPEEVAALPDASTVEVAPSLSGSESFARGIADALGGRYIAPAIGSLIKHGDLSGFKEAQEFYDAPQSGMRTVGQVAGMVLPGAVASKAVKAVGSMPKLASVGKALGTGYKGNIARGVTKALGETAVLTPYASLALRGRLPSAEEVKGDVAWSAGLGAAIPAVGSAASALTTKFINRYRPSVYKAEGLSPGYGAGLGGTDQLRYEDLALQEMKGAVARRTGTGTGKADLVDIIAPGPDDASLLQTAATNPEQRPLVGAMLKNAHEMHPATAEALAGDLIDPSLGRARQTLLDSVSSATGGAGTTARMTAWSNALDDLYGTGINKLKSVKPIPAGDVYKALEAKVGKKIATNLMGDIQTAGGKYSESHAKNLFKQLGLSAMESSDDAMNILSARVGPEQAQEAISALRAAGASPLKGNIHPRDIAAYIRQELRRGAHDPIYFNDRQSVVEALSDILDRTGVPEFMQGHKGWRSWFDTQKAFASGKTAISEPTLSDMSAAMSPTRRTTLPSGAEVRAKQAGLLESVRQSVNTGKPVELSSATESYLRREMPGVLNSIDQYNYWANMRRASTGQPLLQAKESNDIAHIVSRIAWGRKATAAGVLGAVSRRLGGTPDAREAAETMGRLLQAPKGDWKTLMQNMSYKSNLDKIINKAITPTVAGTTTIRRKNSE